MAEVLHPDWHTFHLQHTYPADSKGDFAFESSQTDTFKQVKSKKIREE